jgi:hypothetical protein
MKVQTLFEEELDDYIKRLKKTELMQKLGNGSFATVFQHPVYHNVVVKVFDGNDYGYRDWLRFVKRNQHNDYVPKLVSLHYVENEYGDEIGIVFMKKLSRAPVSKIKLLVKQLNVWCGKDKPIDHNYYFEDFGKHDWAAIARKCKAVDPSLAQVAAVFARNPPEDLHGANVMMDTDGHLIFTDPFAYTDG